MGSGGGGGGGNSETTVRYAPYVEAAHSGFLGLIQTNRDAVINSSPFINYTDIEVDKAFFGTGFLISSFPSLYDMYGKFMAGLDIETLWSQLFEATIDAPVVNDLVAAESALVDDDITTTILPRLQTGMRDVNSVIGSSFVIGKAVIEDARVKTISKFSAELKYKLIPIVQQRWQAHLQWNQNAVGVYSEIMKLYYSTKIDVDDVNYSMATKNKLWPFTVLDFERAALGALQGATNSKTDVAGTSTAKRVIGGALSGAAMGAMIAGESGNPYIIAGGAVVGGLAGAMS